MIGSPRVHLRETGSTSDRARELASAGAPHGTLVTAGSQTGGRGRQGRAWSAPPGRSLACSLVIHSPGPLLSLAAGVAVAEAIGGEARVKWPNDVLLEGDRKVAGILVEGRPQEGWAVLGIGVNVAVRPADLPEELRGHAGTLGRAPADVEPFLSVLLVRLEAWLHAGAAEIIHALRSRDALEGREVRWATGTGVAAGVDDSGRLRVKTPSGEEALAAGEVHLLAVR